MNKKKKAAPLVLSQAKQPVLNQSTRARLEALPFPVVVIDIQTYKVFYANPVAKIDMAKGENFCYRVLHNRQKKCPSNWPCALKEVKKSQRSVVLKHLKKLTAGKTQQVDIFGIPVFDQEGQLVYVIEYLVDSARGTNPGMTLKAMNQQLQVSEIQLHTANQQLRAQALKLRQQMQAEEKAKEEALKNEKKYRSIFDTAANLILSADHKGVIIDCNKRIKAVLGYTRKEVIGKPISQFIHPDYRALAAGNLKTVISKGRSFRDHCQFVRKDGSFIDVVKNSSALKNKQGEFLRTICVLDDITRMKKVEHRLLTLNEQLKANEQKLRDVNKNLIQKEINIRRQRDRIQNYLDIAGVILLVLDRKGCIQLINKKGCELLECSEKYALGKDWFAYFLPKDINKQVKKYFRSIMCGELDPVEYYENEILTRKGKRRIISWHNTIVRNNQGRIVTTLSSGEDITQCKQVEWAARKHERFLDEIIEKTPSPMWISDGKGTIVRVNRALLQLLGPGGTDIVGKYNVLKDAQAKKQGLMPLVRSVFTAKKTINFILHYRLNQVKQIKFKDDGLIVFDIVIAPILDKDENVINAICIHNDITKLILVEEDLKAANRQLKARGRELITTNRQLRSNATRLHLEMSARQKVFNQLQESELRFRTIFEQAGVGVAQIISRTGRFVRINQRYGEIIGYSTSEMLKKTFQDIVHPDDLKADLDSMKLLVGGKIREFTMEKRFCRKDGSVVWVSLSVSPMWSIGEAPDCHITVIADITERKVAQQELLETKEQLSNITENLPGVIFQYWHPKNDAKGAFKYITSGTQKIIGLTADQILSDDDLIRATIVEEDILSLKTTLLKMAKKNMKWDFSWRVKSTEGEIRWVRALASVQQLPDKSYLWDGLLLDVTDRKRVETALVESETKFRSYIENAPDGILVTNKKGQYIEANAAITNITGYSRQQLLKMSMPDLFPDDWKKQAMAHFNSVRTKGLSKGELMHLRKDGSRGYLNIDTVKISEDRYLGFLKDISVRRTAEEASRDSELRFRMFFDQSFFQFFVITDLDGNTLEVNQLVYDVYGCFPTKIIGKPLWEAWFWEKTQEEISTIKKSIQAATKGQRSEHDCVSFDKNGKKVFAARVFQPVKGYSGEIAYISVQGMDITARKKAEWELELKNSELSDVNEKLKHLSDHLYKEREEERKGIARELHDELGQALTALRMDLAWLKTHVNDQSRSLDKIESMFKLIDDTIHWVQKISSEIRPGILDDLGLIAAVEWQAQEFEKRSGLTCLVRSEGEHLVEPKVATVLFRIFQEALTNVLRHARATRITISIISTEDFIQFTIQDNGIGITEKQISDKKSLGVIGMKERLQSLNGSISFKGRQNKGTKIDITIPYF